MAIPFCSNVLPGSCAQRRQQINQWCAELGIEPGRKILLELSDTFCYCLCFVGIPSCDSIESNYCQRDSASVRQGCSNADLPVGAKLQLAIDGQDCYCLCPGTIATNAMTITLADGALLPISELSTSRHRILAAGLDLDFTSHDVALVSEAEHGRLHNAVYIRYGNGEALAELVLSGDCSVLVHRDGGREMIAARRLQLVDSLVDRDGAEVMIATLDSGTFDGPLWDVATRMDPPDENLSGHLILTGGIVTGDLATSIFSTAARSRNSSADPAVGSKHWLEVNGPARVTHPIEVQSGQFKSGALYEIRIPDNASP